VGIRTQRFRRLFAAAVVAGGSSLPVPLRPTTLSLAVTDRSRRLARTTIERSIDTPEVRVRRLTVARDHVYGCFSPPAGSGRRPAVLTFGGSEEAWA
jgi:hypothetical protein